MRFAFHIPHFAFHVSHSRNLKCIPATILHSAQANAVTLALPKVYYSRGLHRSMYMGHSLTLLATVTVYIIIVQLINRVTSLRWLATKQKMLLDIFKIPCGSRVVHLLTSSDVRNVGIPPLCLYQIPLVIMGQENCCNRYDCAYPQQDIKNILARPRNPTPPPPRLNRVLLPPLASFTMPTALVTTAQHVLAEWYVGVDEHKLAAGPITMT